MIYFNTINIFPTFFLIPPSFPNYTDQLKIPLIIPGFPGFPGSVATLTIVRRYLHEAILSPGDNLNTDSMRLDHISHE
jgi:hypothetical protein